MSTMTAERLRMKMSLCAQKGTMPDAKAIASFVRTARTRSERAACLAVIAENDTCLSQEVAKHCENSVWVSTWTNAPEDYDGFGTETMERRDVGGRFEFRRVETPAEHVAWQRARYTSGNFFAVDELV